MCVCVRVCVNEKPLSPYKLTVDQQYFPWNKMYVF